MEENNKEIYTPIICKIKENETIEFSKVELLGRGSFAHCWKVINVQSKQYSALKIIDKKILSNRSHTRSLISEIKLHGSLIHPNIVKFESYFQDQENIYIHLELCNHQTMLDLINRKNRLCEPETRYYFTQLIEGVSYIHSKNIIHRDLKLGNILMDGVRVKIGDFGMATRVEYYGEKKTTLCGTPNYIAPEILKKLEYSYEVDIWSLGIILYAMIIGYPPFETSNINSTYEKILIGKYSIPSDIYLSIKIKNLIQNILRVVPEERLNLNQILMHPFIKHTPSKNQPKNLLLLKDSIIDSLPIDKTIEILSKNFSSYESRNSSTEIEDNFK